MSILIKGMEMPTSCEECPLGDNLHCQVLPSVPALWAEYTNAIREKRLHSDCPLVSVPPHGRLIEKHDVFKLISAFPEIDKLLTVEFMKALYNLPAIIPPEEATQKDGGQYDA